MTLIRYQSPELSPWSAADRLSNLRDELNSFFELPFSSSVARAGQLFSGWSPALDLYEGNDNVTAIVELPGMRKEEIEISLHDGTLTVSGERKRESSSNGDKSERTERAMLVRSAVASHYRLAWMPTKSAPHIEMES